MYQLIHLSSITHFRATEIQALTMFGNLSVLGISDVSRGGSSSVSLAVSPCHRARDSFYSPHRSPNDSI